jgi:hypothetical protein
MSELPKGLVVLVEDAILLVVRDQIVPMRMRLRRLT